MDLGGHMSQGLQEQLCGWAQNFAKIIKKSSHTLCKTGLVTPCNARNLSFAMWAGSFSISSAKFWAYPQSHLCSPYHSVPMILPVPFSLSSSGSGLFTSVCCVSRCHVCTSSMFIFLLLVSEQHAWSRISSPCCSFVCHFFSLLQLTLPLSSILHHWISPRSVCTSYWGYPTIQQQHRRSCFGSFVLAEDLPHATWGSSNCQGMLLLFACRFHIWLKFGTTSNCLAPNWMMCNSEDATVCMFAMLRSEHNCAWSVVHGMDAWVRTVKVVWYVCGGCSYGSRLVALCVSNLVCFRADCRAPAGV